jgi:hypothetical protein
MKLDMNDPLGHRRQASGKSKPNMSLKKLARQMGIDPSELGPEAENMWSMMDDLPKISCCYSTPPGTWYMPSRRSRGCDHRWSCVSCTQMGAEAGSSVRKGGGSDSCTAQRHAFLPLF